MLIHLVFIITYCYASIAQQYKFSVNENEDLFYVDFPDNAIAKIHKGPYIPVFSRDPSEPPCRLIIYHPTKPGKYPVIVFLGGMLGLVPAGWYNDLNTRMAYAGNGAVVITLDLMSALPSSYSVAADYMEKTVLWARSRLYSVLPSSIEVDVQKVFLSTHSSGAQSATVVWTKQSELISGLMYIDPVDAMGDVSNSFPPPVTDPKNPKKFNNLHQPLLIVATGLCDQPSLHLPPPPFLNMSKIKLPPIFSDTNLWPACCPKGLGPNRFWDTLSMKRDIFMWNMTEYGHCDVLDNQWAWTNRMMRFCRSIIDDRLERHDMNSFDLHVIRKTLAALMSSFLDVFWANNKESMQYLKRNEWNEEKVTIKQTI